MNFTCFLPQFFVPHWLYSVRLDFQRWQKHTLLKFLVCALAFRELQMCLALSGSVVMINQSEEDKFISSDT